MKEAAQHVDTEYLFIHGIVACSILLLPKKEKKKQPAIAQIGPYVTNLAQNPTKDLGPIFAVSVGNTAF